MESGLKYYVDNTPNQVMAIWHFIILFCMLCTYLKCSNTNYFKNLTAAIQETADEGWMKKVALTWNKMNWVCYPGDWGLKLNPRERLKKRGNSDSKSPKIERCFHIAGFHNGPLCLKTSFWKVSVDNTRLLKGTPMAHKSLRTSRWGCLGGSVG